jgi:dihydrofolate reductase
MGRLIVATLVSLDGVMQAPGGPGEDDDGGFSLGGWTVPHVDETGGEVVRKLYLDAAGFVLGRRSYDILAGYWPKVTDEGDVLAAKLNTAPKYLVSRTRTSGDWAPTTVVSDAADLAAVKEGIEGYLQVIGSSNLIQSLLAGGLVDELNVWTFPVLIGEGKRLFGDGTRPAGLELASAIRDYIELFHNARRRHSALGMLTPTEYEDRYFRTRDAA